MTEKEDTNDSQSQQRGDGQRRFIPPQTVAIDEVRDNAQGRKQHVVKIKKNCKK
jgi:hypothetical protein